MTSSSNDFSSNTSTCPAPDPDYYQLLPKVELHRHLEGSLRFETVRELARSQGLDLPATERLRALVQVADNQDLSFENFLAKFATLRLFYRSKEIIQRLTYEAIADAAADNVRYMELRFTPAALSRIQGFPLGRVIDWVVEGTHKAAAETGLQVRLIASINRHESPALAAQVALLASERIEQGIVGLDLAGAEKGIPSEPFFKIFHHAKEKGLHICAHAGEWDSGDNVAIAIEKLGAERIGHGVRVLESPHAMTLALQKGVSFEVCLTSNYQSGVVNAVDTHPFCAMLAAGLNVTLNTDDPSISQIQLSDEYRRACEILGLTKTALHKRILAAAQAAFLPPDEKQALVERLECELKPLYT